MIKYPKALFHPGGSLFVIWHRYNDAYCPVISDEDTPPRPEELNLNEKYAGITRIEGLVWRPIRITAERSVVETEDVLTPYDPETGEEF